MTVQIPKRTGLPSLRSVAREMCRLIQVFTPVIRRAYPESLPLLAALEAANAACEVLSNEIDDNLTPGV